MPTVPATAFIDFICDVVVVSWCDVKLVNVIYADAECLGLGASIRTGRFDSIVQWPCMIERASGAHNACARVDVKIAAIIDQAIVTVLVVPSASDAEAVMPTVPATAFSSISFVTLLSSVGVVTSNSSTSFTLMLNVSDLELPSALVASTSNGPLLLREPVVLTTPVPESMSKLPPSSQSGYK